MSDQRTEAGALLRSGLAEVERIAIPAGRKGRAVVVTDLQDVRIGMAWQLPNGWQVDANVTAAIKGGRRVKASASVEW